MLKKIELVFKSKCFYICLAAIITIPYLYNKLPVRIDITQQKSLDNSLWITYSDLSVKSNYILFIPPKSIYTKKENIQYLKQIACNEGDILKVEGKDYYCNDKYIGTACIYDGKGNKVDNFIFNGEIPIDKFFVTGTHHLSYDSKYFGFIDKSQILRKAKPLFEEKNK